jgi:hypothetical protein
MKKLITLILIAFSLSAYAQTASPFLSSGGLAVDSVTNTEATSVALKVTGNYTCASIQYVATKISGTVAGTAVLQVSNDGTNYTTIDSGSGCNG